MMYELSSLGSTESGLLLTHDVQMPPFVRLQPCPIFSATAEQYQDVQTPSPRTQQD